MCSEIPTVPTATAFEVVRHVRELNKLSNSARVAGLAMPSLHLHSYGARGPRFDPTPLLGTGVVLLFPLGAGGSRGLADPAQVRSVVVLDGSWAQARRMVNRMPALGALPRLVVEPRLVDRPRLRQPPVPGGMATLEAIAAAVELLEGRDRAAPLWALFDTLVQRGLALQGKPTRP